MNLFITTPGLPSARSNTQIYVVEQAHALARAGHRVLLLCARPRAHEGEIEDCAVFVEEVFGLRTVVTEYPVVRGLSYLPSVWGMSRAISVAQNVLTPDLIHAHFTLPTGLASVICGRWYGVPVVITEHNGPVRDYCKRRSVRTAMRFALRQSTGVIAVSDHLKAEIEKELKVARDINVIPNLFNEHHFYCDNSGNNTSCTVEVLFIGRGGDSRKGNEVILKAFAVARARCASELRLFLVGPGLQAELRNFVDCLALTPYCFFSETLPTAQVSTLMRRCGFLVLASRYETFGIVLTEAMACGKPVIATRCGGPEELVSEQSGLLVDVDDIQGMAGAMVFLAENLDRYDPNVISHNMYELYSGHVVAGLLSEFYQKIVERRRGELSSRVTGSA